MNMIDYTLPEYVILDGDSHLGNLLEDRDVVQHIRTGTIVDVIAMDDVLASDFKSKQYDFNYTNMLGVKEKFKLVLHHTLADEIQIDGIFKGISDWYCKYLDWVDQSIVEDETSSMN